MTIHDINPYLALLLAGFLPNEVWRLLGVLFGQRIDAKSEVLVWVRAVATAIIAGVVAQIALLPPGHLASFPIAYRLGALAIGYVAYLYIRKSLLAGVIAGEAALILAGWWLGI